MCTNLNKEVYLLKIEVSFLKELVEGGRTFDLVGSGWLHLWIELLTLRRATVSGFLKKAPKRNFHTLTVQI